MRRLLLILPLLLLTAPAVAHAGGFATTGLSSTPAGLRAGQPWKVELTVLQHGVTPLSELRPEIVTIDADGNRARRALRRHRALPEGRAVELRRLRRLQQRDADDLSGGGHPARGTREDRAPARSGRPTRAPDRDRRRAAARRRRAMAHASSPAPARQPGLRAVPKGDPGLKVWVAQGCGSCHTFAPAGATATIGPNLGLSLGGRSRDYIRESIVAPNARVPGGGTSIMPEGFAKRMSKPELDALVKFIAEGVRAR